MGIHAYACGEMTSTLLNGWRIVFTCVNVCVCLNIYVYQVSWRTENVYMCKCVCVCVYLNTCVPGDLEGPVRASKRPKNVYMCVYVFEYKALCV